MGIDLQSEWVATLDNRTRHTHAMLDGQRREIDEPFEVDGQKILYPGYPLAVGSLIYNCRCRVVSVVKGVDMSDAKRRSRDPVTGKSEVIENMTYQEWYAMKEKQHGKEAMSLSWKKIANESSDRKQFDEYTKRLGKNVPKTFEKFQDLKYNNIGEYESLKGLYRYKGRVPEATKKDYDTYLKVKDTGVIGTIRVPPEMVDVSLLKFRDDHASGHGCTEEDARRYVENALCSISRKKWDGISVNYYSIDGATYIDPEKMQIKTSFPRKEFDQTTKSIVGVFE